MRKALAEKKQGADAVSLLLYSNEVQQNLRLLQYPGRKTKHGENRPGKPAAFHPG